MPPPTPHKTGWAWSLATFFGAGYGKPGPGTYGSCAAVLLWLGFALFFRPSEDALFFFTGLAAFGFTAAGIKAATVVARESGIKDPSFVVVDEVAGQFFALLLLTPSIPHALLALGLFRLFDIWKPWPIRRLEELPEGTGIMLDDVAAGILAHVSAQLILFVVHHVHH